MKQKKQRLKPLSSATPEEMQEAFLMAGLWISSELEGHTESGAFSERNLGVPAVEYFPMKAYTTLNSSDCNWKWKEGTKLSTLFINVMKSDMAHVLRNYMDNGAPMVIPTNCMERNNDCFMELSEMELLEDLQQKESRHSSGYKIACAAAKGNSQLEQYVELAFSLPDHRAISKKLRITKPQVLEIEAELIAKIKVMLTVKK